MQDGRVYIGKSWRFTILNGLAKLAVMSFVFYIIYLACAVVLLQVYVEDYWLTEIVKGVAFHVIAPLIFVGGPCEYVFSFFG